MKKKQKGKQEAKKSSSNTVHEKNTTTIIIKRIKRNNHITSAYPIDIHLRLPLDSPLLCCLNPSVRYITTPRHLIISCLHLNSSRSRRGRKSLWSDTTPIPTPVSNRRGRLGIVDTILEGIIREFGINGDFTGTERSIRTNTSLSLVRRRIKSDEEEEVGS